MWQWCKFLFSYLGESQVRTSKNLFYGQLNVNSIRIKFESVQEINQNTFDIFLVCETKTNSFFPNQQFCIPEYRIFRKYHMARVERLLFYVNQKLNCRVLNKCPIRQDFKCLVLELKLSKTDWQVIRTYKSPSINDITFTSEII